jgi:hypothetical protein
MENHDRYGLLIVAIVGIVAVFSLVFLAYGKQDTSSGNAVRDVENTAQCIKDCVSEAACAAGDNACDQDAHKACTDQCTSFHKNVCWACVDGFKLCSSSCWSQRHYTQKAHNSCNLYKGVKEIDFGQTC